MYTTQFGAPMSSKGAALRYLHIVDPDLNQKRAVNMIRKEKQEIVNEMRKKKEAMRSVRGGQSKTRCETEGGSIGRDRGFKKRVVTDMMSDLTVRVKKRSEMKNKKRDVD